MTPVRLALCLALCLVGAQPPSAQGPSAPAYADLVTNVQGRQTTTLNGAWRTIMDPYETGYYDYRYEPQADGGYAANRTARAPGDLVEYQFDASPILYVPGDWNSQREELRWYEGTVWYERDFDYDLPPGRRLFVHVGAANYEAIAWLGGEKLGEHEGGFTPFQFEITDLVRADSTNDLVVKVDNQRRREAVPTINTDWWNYGGLTRDVMLVEVPETFVKDYFVQLDPDDPSRIKGWVRLDGPDAARQPVTVSVPEAGLAETVTTDAGGWAEVSFAAPGLRRWSPEDPHRYAVRVSGGGDRVEEPVGFRTVSTRGHEILLNGEPVFLRGVSVHEEAPFRTGRAYSEADAHALLTWTKEMNGNYVRLAHYPHNETMVRMADSLGLMVWAEIPVYWTIDWENPETYRNAEQQLREMVTRDKNKAAVVLWSVGNETPLSEPRLDFMRRLVEAVRQLDDTRLVTAAIERHYIDDTTLMIDDPLGEHLDVVGVNEYIGWYDGLPPKIDAVSWRLAYDKPVVISEFGAGALQGHRGPDDQRWTEDFQADLYRRTLAMIDRMDFVAGVTPWILKDFRSPKRALPGIQDFWNRKGLVSDRGVKKEAFYVLRDWYRQKEAEYAPAPSGSR